MPPSSAPGRRRSPVVVEWVYIRYRTVMMLAGALLVLAAGGIWWWSSGKSEITEAQAAQRIAAAEQAVEQAASAVPSADALPAARENLGQAHVQFGRRDFAAALSSAVTAEDIARDVLAARHAGTDTGARIVRLEGDVKLKRAGQFLWEGATEHDQLKSGDQIRTGGSGSAQLVYFDGTMTTVSAGTLLEIRELYRDQTRKTQRVAERIEFGGVQAQTQDNEGFDSEHVVTTEDTSVHSRHASEFQVRHDADRKSSEVVAHRGALTLSITGGADVQVAENSRLTIAGGQVVEKAALLDAPRLSTPADQRTFLAPGESLVSMGWGPIEKAAAYRVQVSDRPMFSPLLEERRVDAAALTFAAPRPGTYFWRVVAIDRDGHDGLWSESRKFRIATEGLKDPDDRTPPPLSVTEIMVVGTNAIVSGRSEPGALVWVDGERVDVREDGRFTTVVALRQDGENRIRFVAQDAAGNEVRKTGSAFLDAF